MRYEYRTQGTCSSKIELEMDGNTVKEVRFTGGCDGNLKAISTLVKGMDAAEVIEKCKGITCGYKSTSCGDQLAQAIELALQKENH